MGIGLAPADFWDITLREAAVIMLAASEREARLKRIDDGRVYSLAYLVSFAVNDPKRMPKFEKVFPDGKPKPAQSPDEIWAAMEAWCDMIQAAEGQDG